MINDIRGQNRALVNGEDQQDGYVWSSWRFMAAFGTRAQIVTFVPIWKLPLVTLRKKRVARLTPWHVDVCHTDK
jgi:hypothetical protein